MNLRVVKEFYYLMDREKKNLVTEMSQVKGLMPLLMKPRNKQRWSDQDKLELKLHLQRLSRMSPYLVVVVAAPSFRRYHDHPTIKRFVSGVTAAATGAIAGAAVLLGRRALVDPWTVGIAIATTLVMWRWRVSELWLIACAGVLGLCLR